MTKTGNRNKMTTDSKTARRTLHRNKKRKADERTEQDPPERAGAKHDAGQKCRPLQGRRTRSKGSLCKRGGGRFKIGKRQGRPARRRGAVRQKRCPQSGR